MTRCRLAGIVLVNACRALRIASSTLERSIFQLVALAEICAMLGYFDQSHFSRAFKAVTGMTPGAYRAQTHRGTRE